MAELDDKEKSPDPLALAASPSNELEPDDLAIEEVEEEKGEESAIQDEGEKTDLKPIKSCATDTSAVSGATSSAAAPAKKPWYKNLNPLRWGGIPPVPKERKVSREYTAGFLSLLVFQWMTPLMTVSGLTISFETATWELTSLTGWLQTPPRAE